MNSSMRQRPVVAALLATTMIAGLVGVPAMAQDATAPAAAPAAAPTMAPQGTIRAITVTGTQRLEPDTVLSYTKLRMGQPFSRKASTRRCATCTKPNCSPTSRSATTMAR